MLAPQNCPFSVLSPLPRNHKRTLPESKFYRALRIHCLHNTHPWAPNYLLFYLRATHFLTSRWSPDLRTDSVQLWSLIPKIPMLLGRGWRSCIPNALLRKEMGFCNKNQVGKRNRKWGMHESEKKKKRYLVNKFRILGSPRALVSPPKVLFREISFLQSHPL